MTDENKKTISTLEALCIEPEAGEEARLDADELDAVLYAIDFIKDNEPRRGSWVRGEDEDGSYCYCSECQKVKYRYPFFVGSMRQPRYCEYCGSLNNEEGKV